MKKKLLIVGTATSVYPIDYNDKNIEIWGLGSCLSHPEIKRLDMVFEMHSDKIIEEYQIKRGTNFKQYGKIPIMVQDEYSAVVNKYMDNPVTFPLADVLSYVERNNLHKMFTCSITYALVYAIMMGYTDVEIRKVALSTDQEYTFERPAIVYYCSTLAIMKGVKVFIPDDSYINFESKLYGYEEQEKKHLVQARNLFLWKDYNRNKELYDKLLLEYGKIIGQKELFTGKNQQKNRHFIKVCDKNIQKIAIELQKIREKLIMIQGCLQAEIFYNELIK